MPKESFTSSRYESFDALFDLPDLIEEAKKVIEDYLYYLEKSLVAELENASCAASFKHLAALEAQQQVMGTMDWDMSDLNKKVLPKPRVQGFVPLPSFLKYQADYSTEIVLTKSIKEGYEKHRAFTEALLALEGQVVIPLVVEGKMQMSNLHYVQNGNKKAEEIVIDAYSIQDKKLPSPKEENARARYEKANQILEANKKLLIKSRDISERSLLDKIAVIFDNILICLALKEKALPKSAATLNTFSGLFSKIPKARKAENSFSAALGQQAPSSTKSFGK